MSDQVTCRCNAFEFPHRQGCKGCEHTKEAATPDTLESLGLVGLFKPDNTVPLRFNY